MVFDEVPWSHAFSELRLLNTEAPDILVPLMLSATNIS